MKKIQIRNFQYFQHDFLDFWYESAYFANINRIFDFAESEKHPKIFFFWETCPFWSYWKSALPWIFRSAHLQIIVRSFQRRENCSKRKRKNKTLKKCQIHRKMSNERSTNWIKTKMLRNKRRIIVLKWRATA